MKNTKITLICSYTNLLLQVIKQSGACTEYSMMLNESVSKENLTKTHVLHQK